MRKRGLCRRKMAVCPSIYPSHAGIVSKRLNLSQFFDHLVAPIILVFWTLAPIPNSMGNPVSGA